MFDGPAWRIAEGETAPRVTIDDCWIADSIMKRLIARHSPEATPDAAPSGAPEKAVPEVTPDDGDKKGGKALVAWQAVVLENWPKIAERQNKPSAREVMKWLRDNGPRDTFPKEQKNNRDSLYWIDIYGQAKTLAIKRLGTVLSEWCKAGKIPA